MDSKHQAHQVELVQLDSVLQNSAEQMEAQGHGKAEALPVLSGSCFNERSTVKKFQ